MGYLVIDTDVWSFLYKGDTRTEAYRPYLDGHTLCVSFQTVAELYRWAFTRNWGERRIQQLELTLQSFVVLPYDHTIAITWARICTEREKTADRLARKMPGLPPARYVMDVHLSRTMLLITGQSAI